MNQQHLNPSSIVAVQRKGHDWFKYPKQQDLQSQNHNTEHMEKTSGPTP